MFVRVLEVVSLRRLLVSVGRFFGGEGGGGRYDPATTIVRASSARAAGVRGAWGEAVSMDWRSQEMMSVGWVEAVVLEAARVWGWAGDWLVSCS